MHIISASRRTDIPAFYADWFMGRLRAGYARWPHLFGGPPAEVSLRPEDVSAIVFWSKDYRLLLCHLDELDSRGYAPCFQFTITGLPPVFEPRVPPAEVSVAVAHALAARYRQEAVLWRYDPVVTSSITDPAYHRARFAELAAAMEGATRRCHISFPHLYAKVRRRAEALAETTGISMASPSVEEQAGLAGELAVIAARHGIALVSCCSDGLLCDLVGKAHCIDGDLLRSLYPDRVGRVPLRPSRTQCGCSAAIDIGAYNTCPHGCIYCYANADKELVERNHTAHRPDTDMITRPSGIEGPPTGEGPGQLALPGLGTPSGQPH